MEGYLCADCGTRKKKSGDAGVLGRGLRWELTGRVMDESVCLLFS
jgi:hypothetical protein